MRDWQLVLIAWGEKYGAREINDLVSAALAGTLRPARVALLTDRFREGLHDAVKQFDIPVEFLKPAFLRSGCQAKLAMFAKGVLPDDMVALYVDLDTVVLGDLGQLIACRRGDREVALLQSAILPFGAFARLLYRLSAKRHYARGNSSLVSFHPAHCHEIAESFLALEAQYGLNGFKPLSADERFISWVMQPVARAIPRRLAVKFPTEFMYPSLFLGRILNNLPWVKARRRHLVAISLPGEAVKAEILLALPEGAQVKDMKGRRMIWSDAYLGESRTRLMAKLRG